MKQSSLVDGYDNYIIYRNGVLYNSRRHVIINGSVNTHGYRVFALSKNDKRKSMKAHRLVALAFIPNPHNKQQVNHIDGNKLNNNVDNLEWCTHTENMQHAHRTGLKEGSHIGKYGAEHPASKMVEQRDIYGVLVETFGSALEAKRETGVHNSGICDVANGTRATAGRFKWNWKKD